MGPGDGGEVGGELPIRSFWRLRGRVRRRQPLDTDGVDTAVRVEIDYSQMDPFDSNDWIHQLQLVSVDDCTVDTPTDSRCVAVLVQAFESDPTAMVLTGEIVGISLPPRPSPPPTTPRVHRPP